MQPFTSSKPATQSSTGIHQIAGEPVEAVAWCDENGNQYAVNGFDIAPATGSVLEEVLFLVTRQPTERASAPVQTVVGRRREMTDGQVRTLDDGAPAYVWRDYYLRPDGSLFAFNVYTLGDEQTLSRSVQVNGGTKLRDIYLVKGFRFATPDEFKRALAAARSGRDREQRRRDANTPEGRASEMARLQAEAMREAMTMVAQSSREQRKGGGANG